jgi:hypothetical protein
MRRSADEIGATSISFRPKVFSDPESVVDCANALCRMGTGEIKTLRVIMSTINISAANSPTAVNGRPLKFTPERIEQIKNLVERGLSREQIAEMVGVTLGSLQVTCSRLGISLRRVLPAGAPTRRDAPRKPKAPAKAAVGYGVALALRMQYRDREQFVELPLSQDLFGWLVLVAQFQNLSIGEMVAKLVAEAAMVS